MNFETFYEHLCNCLLERYSWKNGDSIDNESKEEILLKLGVLALNGLDRDSVVCKKDSIFHDIDPNAFKYGFIIGEVDRRIVRNFSADVRVSFIHRSVQEYLAARYVVNQIRSGKMFEEIVPASVQKEPLEKYFLFTSLVYKMLGALMPNVVNETIGHVNEQENTEEAHSNVIAQRKALHELVRHNFKGADEVTIAGYEVVPTLIHFFVEGITKNDTMVHLHLSELDLSNCLLEVFSGRMPMLSNLLFTKCQFEETKATSQDLSAKNIMPNLKTASFTECTFSSQSPMIILGKVLSRSGTLKEIKFLKCDIEHKLLSLLSVPFDMLQTLSIDSCNVGESLMDIHRASLSFCRLQNVLLQDVQAVNGLSAILAKCITSSSRKVRVDITFDKNHSLDPDFFCRIYPSLEHFTLGVTPGRRPTKEQYAYMLSSLEKNIPKDSAQLCANADKVGGGEMPILKELTISSLALGPDTMKNIVESLQCNHQLISVRFQNCILYDSFTFLGKFGTPTIDQLEFQKCSVIENEYDPALPVGVGGLGGLTKLECPFPMPPKAYDILSQSIAKCMYLNTLSIPGTDRSLRMLLDIGLDGLQSFKLFVGETKSVLTKCPVEDYTTLQPFPMLKDLSFVGVVESVGGSTYSKPRLSGHVWKVFLSSLAGHKGLSKCQFWSLDLTNCLGVLLAEELPSLTTLDFQICILAEDDVDPETFKGNLPAVTSFKMNEQFESHPNVVANSAFKVLFASLAGSLNLRDLSIGPMKRTMRDYYWQDVDTVEKHNLELHHDLTGCLGLLFCKPLPALQEVWFDLCLLSEDIKCFSAFKGNLPGIQKLDTSKMQVQFDNSVLRLMCACLTGSSNLNQVIFGCHIEEGNSLNLTKCLALLFKEPLINLAWLDFRDCILDENMESIDQVGSVSPILPSLCHLDISAGEIHPKHAENLEHIRQRPGQYQILSATNTKISSSAMCFILKALAGSTKLESLAFDGYDMSNSLHRLFKEPLGNLKRITFTNCVLDESLASNALLECPSSILPRIRKAVFFEAKEGTEAHRTIYSYSTESDIISATKTKISSSAMHVICSALAGSENLQTAAFDGYNLTNCLSVLLCKTLPKMDTFLLVHCILNEDMSVQNSASLGITGSLDGVSSVDISTCQVSNSAARVITNAVGGSRNLKTFKVFDTDLTGCLPLLFNQQISHKLRGYYSYSWGDRPLNTLTELEVEGCSFKDSESSTNIQKGTVSQIKSLDLTCCQFVSGHAAQMLLDAVSESDKLTSVKLADVDLIGVQPAMYRLPALRSLSMEGCLLSKGQINALVQAREDGYLKCLQHLYLNRAKGLAGSFMLAQTQIKSGDGEGQIHNLPAPKSFIPMCIGLLVLGVRDSDITKADIQILAEAISTDIIDDLRKIEINRELCDPDVVQIFQQHNVSLLDMAAKPAYRLNPDQISPKPCVQHFTKP